MTGHPALERRSGSDRRLARAALRYPERRTGFDRRVVPAGPWSSAIAWYRDRPGAVAACSALIVVLGLADVVLTSRLIGLGATELNPVMAGFFAAGPGAALLFKALMVVPVAAAVWWLRRFRRVLEFSLVVLAVSVLLVVYEMAGLALLAG